MQTLRRTLPSRRVLSHLILAAIFAATFAQASDIGLSPPRLTLAGSPGQTITETVTLITNSSERLQVGTEISDWTLDVTGNVTFLPASSLEYSAANWISLESTDFFLEPNSSRDLRVSVTIPPNAEGGTYHDMVFFRVVPPESAMTGVGVVTTTRIGLTLYITVAGTERNSAEVVDFFQQDETSLTLAVANTGNTLMRLGGQIELRGEMGEVVHNVEVPNVPILRNSERELTLPLPEVEAGFYVALALIQDSRGELLVAELPISVP